MSETNFIQENVRRIMTVLNDKHQPFVRRHLAEVYIILGCATASTAIGCLLQILNMVDFEMKAAVATIGLAIGLHLYSYNGKNYWARLIMLLSFGFCSGQTMAPILQYVLILNAAILFLVIVGTAIIFISLSISALLAERGKYMILSSVLVTVTNTMAFVGVLNMVFQSYSVQMTQLYVGIILTTVFVLYDTQNIIEKCRRGNRDVVTHAMDLFFDLLGIFRRLLIILTQKEHKKYVGCRFKQN